MKLALPKHYALTLKSIFSFLLFAIFFFDSSAQIPSASAILPAGSTVKEIFSGGEEFLEGSAMSPDGLLYFSDFPNFEGKANKAGIIWTLNPATGESKVFRSPSGMSNGL